MRTPVIGLAMNQPNPITEESLAFWPVAQGAAGADTPTLIRATEVRPALSVTCRLT
jgi:hypothetical protein